MNRRQSLVALAKSRGLDGASVWSMLSSHGETWLRDATAWDDYGNERVVVRAPTRRAAEAGLRAALLAMPVKKEKKR